MPYTPPIFDLFNGNAIEFLKDMLYFLPALLIGFVLHEYAHAWVANRSGDPTAKFQGRLTLNPFVHIDPIGFIMLLFMGFGWAKPVPVNHTLIGSRKKNRRKWRILVSLAGIIVNMTIAFVFFMVFELLRKKNIISTETNIGDVMINLFAYIIQINIVLAFFNLIPIPPLDGSWILGEFIGTPRWMINVRMYGQFILLALVFSGVLMKYLSFMTMLTFQAFFWIFDKTIGLLV